MGDPRKHLVIGILGYMAIMFFSAILSDGPSSSIANSFGQKLLFVVVFGPIMWLAFLVVPAIFLVGIYAVLRYARIRISPSLISSTLIFYALSFIVADSVFDMFKTGEGAWQLIVLAGISSAAGYTYANCKTPDQD